MKVLKRIVLATLAACLLIVPFVGTASAVSLVDPENINSIMEYFGIDANDPNSVQGAIDEIREGGLSAILNILGIDVADILDELESYLGAMSPPSIIPQETTTVPETTTEQETTTEPETTAPPTTLPPTTVPPVYTPTYPSYNYVPSTQAPTLPPETTTFQFIPPEQIYTEAITTTVFKPIVEDDVSLSDDTNPFKTAIGVLLLLGSGIGVIFVVLALKRNRI